MMSIYQKVAVATVGTVLSLGAIAIPSQATELELGFESGDFTRWETIGDAAVLSNGNPPKGTYQAGLSTFNAGSEIPVCTLDVDCDRRDFSFTEGTSQAVWSDKLQEFLDIFTVETFANGSLDALGLKTPIEGSAIATVLTLELKEAIEFKWNFLTNDYSNDDFAFVAISRLDTQGNPEKDLLFQPLATSQNSIGNLDLIPSNRILFDPPRESFWRPVPGGDLVVNASSSRYERETGFKTFRFVPDFLSQPTPVSVVFGVVDVGSDAGGASALLIDDVTVPEPTSVLGLLTIGALGAGSTLKRKQK